jgi:hypothetical protein
MDEDVKILEDGNDDIQEHRNGRSSSAKWGWVCYLRLRKSLCNPCSYNADVSDKDRDPGPYAKDRN